MKKIAFITAAFALSMSASGAFAQPSQAQGGGATAPTSNPPAASDATRPGTMDKGGTTSTGGAMNNSSNPPSQGKGGPTTGGPTK